MTRGAWPANSDLVEGTGHLVLVACPDCGATAEVEWQSAGTGTDCAPVLVKIRCLNRHWFLMPAS
jgi:hypothetical protein